MKRTWFVTGTDTEIGKTAATSAMLAAASKAGLRTLGLKPVAAGCDHAGENEDALALMDSASVALPYEQVNPVALAEAIAPHIAAEREGRNVQVGRLAGLCRGAVGSEVDFALIEGAGGWRVPLNRRETLADLPRELQLPVILVVGMRLGCINHALLTAEAIRRDGLQLAGWVANQPAERMACHEENVDTLQRWIGAPFLGELPHLSPFSPEKAANYLNINILTDSKH